MLDKNSDNMKFEGLFSPQYDIPAKGGTMNAYDFTQATLNLRKQHTSTKVKSSENEEMFAKYSKSRKSGAINMH